VKLKFTEQDIMIGLDKEEFTLYYQPIVFADKKIVGCEALVRWLHPKHGLLLPGVFLGVIENNPPLLYKFCGYVMLKACAQGADWIREFPGLSISVNVSSLKLGVSYFAAIVEQSLDRSSIPPQNLVLELTERTPFSDIELMGFLPLFLSLQKIGVRLALDDFGTGYNSLVWLKKLPIDILKLDQVFTRMRYANEEVIVQWVCKLADLLSLEITAEGVEDIRQVRVLRHLGYTQFQGYFFYPPMKPEKLTALLKLQSR
jgi:EAL domain-containing protein (putative c-di-GMP-specific phosphodiesterase class I)